MNKDKGSTALTNPYRCVYCLSPCSSLYRKYSASTIKLSQCSSEFCKNNKGRKVLDVDPYCEREWLLVVLDIVLLREEAYRHVLCNRMVNFDISGNYGTIIQYSAVSSLLDAYIIWESHFANSTEPSTTPFDPQPPVLDWNFLQLAMIAFIRLSVQAVGVWLVFMLVLHMSQSLPSTAANKLEWNVKNLDKHLITKIWLALVMPTACRIVTIMVQIWENTDTVRLLGSLLLVSYKCMALSVVAALINDGALFRRQDGKGSNSNSSSNGPLIISATALLVGWLFQAVLLSSLSWFLMTRVVNKPSSLPLPCFGFQWHSYEQAILCFT